MAQSTDLSDIHPVAAFTLSAVFKATPVVERCRLEYNCPIRPILCFNVRVIDAQDTIYMQGTWL